MNRENFSEIFMGKGFCLVHAFFQTCAPLFEAVSIRRLGCVAPSALFLVGVGSRKGNGGCRIQFVGYLQTCKFVVFNAHGNLNIGYALRFLCGYAKHFFRRSCGKCQRGLCFFRGKRVLSLQKIVLGNFRYVKENFFGFIRRKVGSLCAFQVRFPLPRDFRSVF